MKNHKLAIFNLTALTVLITVPALAFAENTPISASSPSVGVQLILMFTSALIGGLISGFLTYLFTVRIEEKKFAIFQREQAARIAELFSEWTKYGGKDTEYLKGEQLRERFTKLNKLTWELTIWIPDEILVKEIMKRLNNAGNAKDIKEIIIKVREILSNKKCTSLKAEELIDFRIPEKDKNNL